MSSEMIIYNTEDGLTRVELRLDDGTVWLTQLEMAELFQSTKQNISKHIKAILDDGELEEKATVNYRLTTATDGKNYNVACYNLDMILAVGYRMRSARGAQVWRYASTILKEYLTNGFAIKIRNLLKWSCGFMLIQLVQSFVVVVRVRARDPIYGVCDIKSDGFHVRIMDFKSPIYECVVALHENSILHNCHLLRLNSLQVPPPIRCCQLKKRYSLFCVGNIQIFDFTPDGSTDAHRAAITWVV